MGYSDINTLMVYYNRAAAVPILGTVLGPLRALVCLVVGVVCGVFAIKNKIQNKKEYNGGSFDIAKYSFSLAALGIAETIPIVGTIVHVILHAIFRKDRKWGVLSLTTPYDRSESTKRRHMHFN